jgi:hypothetical protein
MVASGTLACAGGGGDAAPSVDDRADATSQVTESPSGSSVLASDVPSTSTSAATSTTEPSQTTLPADPPPVPRAMVGLAPRDCYIINGDMTILVAACGELHDGQVYKVGVPLVGITLDEQDPARWVVAATEPCREDFEEFVGEPLGSEFSDYTLGFVLTSGGDPRVVVACTVVTLEGPRWAGTAEDIKGSYSGIEVGDCFNFPTPSEDALEMQCAEPHEGEMYVVEAPVGAIDPASPYPTPDEWNVFAEAICVEPFEQYTGIPIESAPENITFTYLTPLEEAWSEVTQRTMSCVIVTVDGTALTGSQRRP